MTEEAALIEQLAKALYGIDPNGEWPKMLLSTKISYRRKAKATLEMARALEIIKAVFPDMEVLPREVVTIKGSI